MKSTLLLIAPLLSLTTALPSPIPQSLSDLVSTTAGNTTNPPTFYLQIYPDAPAPFAGRNLTLSSTTGGLIIASRSTSPSMFDLEAKDEQDPWGDARVFVAGEKGKQLWLKETGGEPKFKAMVGGGEDEKWRFMYDVRGPEDVRVRLGYEGRGKGWVVCGMGEGAERWEVFYDGKRNGCSEGLDVKMKMPGLPF